MINLNALIRTADIEKTWVVYILYNAVTAAPVFVGHCKLNQLFALPDARRDMGAGMPEAVILRVTDECADVAAAARAHRVRVQETGIAVDLARYRMKRVTSLIECVETGEKWPTIVDAARAHGLGAGNLSNHLRGAPGFNTVKGKTYRRVAQ